MSELTFPSKPSSRWADDNGAQAIFEVVGATEAMASLINSVIPTLGLGDTDWEVIVSELRPDQVMVVCEAGISQSAFTRGLRAIAGYGQTITHEMLSAYEEDRKARTKEAMAVDTDDTMAWSGSATNT